MYIRLTRNALDSFQRFFLFLLCLTYSNSSNYNDELYLYTFVK